MLEVASAYCDGGVCGPNPSELGGSWAYCWVAACGQVRLSAAAGFVEPGDLGVGAVTNNHTELYAAVRCLEALGPDWRGVLHTDSLVTLNRLTRREPQFANVPRWLINRAVEVRRWRPRVELVAGHPTLDELKAGRAKRNGLPVSPHNCYVDQLCTAASGRFKAGIKGMVA